MLRRKHNSSRFVKGGEAMKWHVELRFISADVVHHEKCVPDSRTLLEVCSVLLFVFSVQPQLSAVVGDHGSRMPSMTGLCQLALVPFHSNDSNLFGRVRDQFMRFFSSQQ